jgi:signal transduction histidine kinase
MARLIEMERVRTRIATDLHDDIGSSLSRMAILSEVVKRQVGGAAQEAVPMLTEMAESSRGLLDSMSDIVWSIDPRRDDLSDLALRIRQFASDVFEARQIAWDLHIPQEFDRVRLNAAQRRQVFLIFKEAVNNIARHAGCSTARLNVHIAHHRLSAEIHDNGCGFDLSGIRQLPAIANGNGGHGLESMQRRAAQIGGHLEIHSAPGKGTVLKLTIPLKKS